MVILPFFFLFKQKNLNFTNLLNWVIKLLNLAVKFIYLVRNFVYLMDDITFKESFANPYNRRQLERFFEAFLSLPKGFLKDKLLLNYESLIDKANIDEKNSRTDISVEFDDILIDLEAYSYLDQESVYKSTFYVMKISASRFIKGMEYEPFKVIQFNCTNHKEKIENKKALKIRT